MRFGAAIPFAFVCLATGLGVDYFTQSKAEGHELGQMSVGQYVDTFAGRFLGMQAERSKEVLEEERQRMWAEGGKPFLPEAPEGWVRRAVYDPGFSGIVLPSVAAENHSAEALAVATALAHSKVSKRIQKADQRGWIYQRDGKTVWIDVSMRRNVSSNSLMGLAAQTIEASSELPGSKTGVAVLDGVGFVEKSETYARISQNDNWAFIRQKPLQEYTAYRRIEGRIGFGQEIGFRVLSDASDDEILEILALVDYKGLNNLLRVPMPTVGQGIEVPEDLQAETAIELEEVYGEFKSLKAAAAQQKLNNMDASALVMNTMAANYGIAREDGVVDLTGGKTVDLTTQIHNAYRQGVAFVLITDLQQASLSKEAVPSPEETAPLKVVENPEEPKATPPKEVKVRKGGGFGVGNCSKIGGSKRCSIQTD